MQHRFIRRTWRRTSQKICQANDIPPGFRIVLLDEQRRVRRDDLIVRSGGFGSYPVDWPISVFLDTALHNNVKELEQVVYTVAELRNHRDEPIDPEITLRRVRDMPGLGDSHSDDWWTKHDETLLEIQNDVEEALGAFEDDFRLIEDPDLLLKAVI